MNAQSRIRPSWTILVLMLSALACNLGAPGGATEIPATLPPSAEAPPAATATEVFQGAMPVGLPAQRADQAGDIDSSPNAHRQMVTGGDVFVHGLYERPFNRDPMDKYFPYLDIVDVQGYTDDTWGYASITMQKAAEGDALPGQYAVELDLDRDGRGEWLIRVAAPSSTDWSRQGVQVWKETNGDVGGVAVMTADSKPRGGDGYDDLVFDEGNGDLSDGAWARLSPNNPRTVELAFKLEMLGNPKGYAMGAWAGTSVDPAMFDYHDHMTHIQAGSPNPGYEVYPLKDMAEIDNTCRLAINFAPTGKEPGLCATVSQREGEGGTVCVPRRCPLSMFDPNCVPVICP
jgi:hypothetical protein